MEQCGETRGPPAKSGLNYRRRANTLFSIVMTESRVECVMLAALLHDVGHYPLAHDLEEAYFTAFDHEARSIKLLLNHPGLRAVITSTEDQGWNSSPENVASIIAGHPLSGSSIKGMICELLHSIISGPIDADKLDYLRRDSAHLNVAAGQGIDIDRVISSLTTAVVLDDKSSLVLRMAVRAKGRRPTELVGRIRSHMFGVAYWHHSYRSIKAMIHWITWAAMEHTARLGGRSSSTPLKLSSALFKVLDDAVMNMEPQPELFGMKRIFGDENVLPRAEGEILSWLAERGGTEASELFDLLSRHLWFRSILTIEHPKQQEVHGDAAGISHSEIMWNGMDTIYKLSEDKRWRVRMNVARRVQTEILDWIRPQTEGLCGTVVFDFKNMRDRLLAAGKRRRLFLVDGPDPSRAFQKPLYYTRVQLRQSTSVDAVAAIPAVRSFDDKELADEFVVTNGAIRLLCHPEFDSFIVQAIPNEVLRDLLTIALRDQANGLLGR